MLPAWFRGLDALLRAEPSAGGVGGALDDRARPLDPRRLLMLAIALGAAYGFFMGWFALSGGTWGGVLQMFSGMFKLPLVFVLTMVVTLPSLYVFSALMGSRMPIDAVLRMLLSAAVVSLAVAASLGPILGFFTLSTTNYAFMVLLNVGLLGLAGFTGLNYLLRTLRARTGAQPMAAPVQEEFVREEAPTPAPVPSVSPPPPPLEAEDGYGADPRTPAYPGFRPPVARVFRPVPPPRPPAPPRDVADAIIRVWVLICGVVGLQMAWLLRPFIGSPDLAFQLFRPKEGNVFQSLVGTAGRLLGL